MNVTGVHISTIDRGGIMWHFLEILEIPVY